MHLETYKIHIHPKLQRGKKITEEIQSFWEDLISLIQCQAFPLSSQLFLHTSVSCSHSLVHSFLSHSSWKGCNRHIPWHLKCSRVQKKLQDIPVLATSSGGEVFSGLHSLKHSLYSMVLSLEQFKNCVLFVLKSILHSVSDSILSSEHFSWQVVLRRDRGNVSIGVNTNNVNRHSCAVKIYNQKNKPLITYLLKQRSRPSYKLITLFDMY